MCTSITFQTKDFYFGRTLDFDFSYAEEVTITPRNFPFFFRKTEPVRTHYAMVGMAYVPDDYPLYYDAFNEKGLCIAGLNFVGNAHYNEPKENMLNLAQFELIPYLLGTCASVEEVLSALKDINVTNTPYCEGIPLAQLHWLIADKRRAITLEIVKDGMKIYENPVGVLTNNPPFPEQLSNLNNYRGLSRKDTDSTFASGVELKRYSRGMGAIGLPGDLSSQSRFVRVAFTKCNSVSGESEAESVNQFFHLLGSVEQTRGACEVADGKFEITIYTSCCNADKGIYYYTTYENQGITAVDLREENLDDSKLFRYPLLKEEKITYCNRK